MVLTREPVLATRHMSLSRLSLMSTTLLFCLVVFMVSKSEGVNHITCGSVVKLENESKPKFRLHSHDIKYASGSGQQSVTAAENQDSYWSILGEKNKPCNRGTPIECGSKIRLQHIQTRKYLHSHLFRSALSSQQEVSAFGNDDDSDTGDHWMVYCKNKYWLKSESARFRHVDTSVWLSLSGNTYGRPIFGQLEVIGAPESDKTSFWRAAEGVYVEPTNKNEGPITHDEL